MSNLNLEKLKQKQLLFFKESKFEYKKTKKGTYNKVSKNNKTM